MGCDGVAIFYDSLWFPQIRLHFARYEATILRAATAEVVVGKKRMSRRMIHIRSARVGSEIRLTNRPMSRMSIRGQFEL